MGMEITVWDDSYIMPNERPDPKWNESDVEVLFHRRRQKKFYQKCLQYLFIKKLNWTALIDVDEYIVLNPILSDKTHLFRKNNNSKSNYMYTSVPVDKRSYSNTMKAFGRDVRHRNIIEFNERLETRTRIPPIGTITVAQLIE